MKRLRNRVILMLVIINLFSLLLAGILTWTLTPVFFDAERQWASVLLISIFQHGFALIIFTVFVILGIREITVPIVRLAKAANQIANGDFHVEVPETRRKDELGQLGRSFAVMARELQCTEYIQRDFVSNVSHEYRTPLAVIDGYASLLETPGLSEEDRLYYSGLIREETQRLGQMTHNVLLLSKLESLGIPPPFSIFSLDEQLRQAAVLYFAKCQDKNLQLELDVPAIHAFGNESLLMHVWLNLLGNAVKFTAEGGMITLCASRSPSTIVVTVKDTGIGMDEAVRSKLFDQFYQGETAYKSFGSGLGLPLALRIVQLHQGVIHVDSVSGEGTTFDVHLPQITDNPLFVSA